MSKLIIALALLISSIGYADARSKEYLFGSEGVFISCSAFKHNADGSWDVVAQTLVKGAWGTMTLNRGAHFASGQPINIGGLDILAVLNTNCK